MFAQRAQLGSGPLSSAAVQLGEASVGGAGPSDPAVFLGRLLDLRGGVELGQGLDANERLSSTLAPSTLTAAGRTALLEELRALVTGRTGALQAEILRTFADPFNRRTKLATPERVVEILVEMDALGGGAERSLAIASESVWAPCADLLGRALQRVRFELGGVRDELGPALTSLGGATARLEGLDAALFSATAKGRAELEDRLLAAVGRAFAKRFALAVAKLSTATTPSQVRPWFEVGGVLRAELDRGRDVVLGVLDHDRRRLAALVADS